MERDWRNWVILVVTAVWALNMTATVWHPSYVAPAELNVAFMAIVGAIVASYNVKPPSNGDGSQD